MKKLPEIGSNYPEVEGVNILRKDYLLDKRVVLATARAKRPEQFTATKEKPTLKKNCPLCPENQDKIILADEIPIPDAHGWLFRSAVNPFAIMAPRGDLYAQQTSLLEESNAYGHAEVVIETPDHKKQLEDLPKGTIANWLQFLAQRVKELKNRPGVRYVSVFKNRGRIAGASISHSHTQIITTPHIPRKVRELREANNKYVVRHGRNAYLDILAEEHDGPRFVTENEHMACFTPFASEVPMEVWIVPKRFVTSITRLTTEERDAIENILKKLLKQLNKLGTPPYNLLFMSDNEYSQTQFHLRLYPRIGTPQAGFEYTTDLHVNPTLPEDAAAFYKKGC